MSCTSASLLTERGSTRGRQCPPNQAIGYDAGRYQGDLGAYVEDLKIYILDPNYPSQTVTPVPNSGAKEYYELQYPENRWRTYFKAVGGGFTRDLLSRPAGPWRFTGARLTLVIDVK